MVLKHPILTKGGMGDASFGEKLAVLLDEVIQTLPPVQLNPFLGFLCDIYLEMMMVHHPLLVHLVLHYFHSLEIIPLSRKIQNTRH